MAAVTCPVMLRVTISPATCLDRLLKVRRSPWVVTLFVIPTLFSTLIRAHRLCPIIRHCRDDALNFRRLVVAIAVQERIVGQSPMGARHSPLVRLGRPSMVLVCLAWGASDNWTGLPLPDATCVAELLREADCHIRRVYRGEFPCASPALAMHPPALPFSQSSGGTYSTL